MTKEEIQEMLDNQSELYAECLGEVEDRLMEQVNELLDKKLEKVKDDICYRIYKGIRVQFGKLRDDERK